MQAGFEEQRNNFDLLHEEQATTQNLAAKALDVASEMRYLDALEEIDGFYDTIMSKESLEEISSTMQRSYAQDEISAKANKCFKEQKLATYMKDLYERHGLDACVAFYKYCIAVRAKFLTIQALYLTYCGKIKQLEVEYKKFNVFHCKLTEQLGQLDKDNEAKIAFNENGETKLHVAIQGNDKKVISFFVQNLLNKNPVKAGNNGWSCLHEAAKIGDLDTLTLIIDSGCAMFPKTENYLSPYDIAAKHGHLSIIKYYAPAMKDINPLRLQYDKSSPLADAISNGHFSVVEYIFQKIPNKDQVIQKGVLDYSLTAIHTAIYSTSRQNISILEFLCESGNNVNKATNSYNYTSLSMAAGYNKPEALKCLLQYTKDFSPDGHGDTPLHNSAYGCNLECFVILLPYVEDFTIKNKRGETALDMVPKEKKAMFKEAIDKEMERRRKRLPTENMGKYAKRILKDSMTKEEFYKSINTIIGETKKYLDPEIFPILGWPGVWNPCDDFQMGKCKITSFNHKNDYHICIICHQTLGGGFNHPAINCTLLPRLK